MSVIKNRRALVLISQLDKGVEGGQKWLYRFIEESGLGTVNAILGDDYGHRRNLLNADATKAKLLSTLQQLGSNPVVREIDLIVMLHGHPNKLGFHEGGVSTPALGNDIAALNLKPKLRMVYSTACYGRSHADDFVKGGFNVAIGAIGVNASAAVEVPAFLNLWSLGWSVKDALGWADTPATRMPQDAAAIAYCNVNGLNWCSEVNSDKVHIGDGSIKIDTNAS